MQITEGKNMFKHQVCYHDKQSAFGLAFNKVICYYKWHKLKQIEESK